MAMNDEQERKIAEKESKFISTNETLSVVPVVHPEATKITHKLKDTLDVIEVNINFLPSGQYAIFGAPGVRGIPSMWNSRT